MRHAAGTLRLDVPTIVASRVLPPIGSAFLAAQPAIRLEVETNDSFIDGLAAGFCRRARRRTARYDRDPLGLGAIDEGAQRRRRQQAAGAGERHGGAGRGGVEAAGLKVETEEGPEAFAGAGQAEIHRVEHAAGAHASGALDEESEGWPSG